MKEEREGNKERGNNREGEEDRRVRSVMQCRIEREYFYSREKRREAK